MLTNALLKSDVHNNFMTQIVNSYINNEFRTKTELCQHYKITLQTLSRYEKLYNLNLTKKPPENFNTFRESFLNDNQPEKIKTIINEAEKATKNIRDINGNVVDTEADYNIQLRAANLAAQFIEPSQIIKTNILNQTQNNNQITVNQNQINLSEIKTEDLKKLIDITTDDKEEKK